MAGCAHRAAYDGIVLTAPVSVPYERYSKQSAHWWIGRALHGLKTVTGLGPADIDGLSVSSFTLFPDTAVGLTQHFGVSPRWLDHIPMGGASGVVALRRAGRAVQAGDADVVACVAGDTNHVNSFRSMLTSFSRFSPGCSLPLWIRRAECFICADDGRLYENLRSDTGRLWKNLRRSAAKCALIPIRAYEKTVVDR